MKTKRIYSISEKKILTEKLRNIRSQIAGIEHLAEADADVSNLLAQVVSARRALNSLSRKILQSHIRRCLEMTMTKCGHHHELREFQAVLNRYIT